MFRYILTAIWLMASGASMSGQDVLTFYVDPQFLQTGESFSLAVKTSDFDDIDGFQFSMEWDTAHFQLDSIVDMELPQFSEANFGTSGVDSGILSVLWSGNTSQGETLTDSTIVFKLIFQNKGGCSDDSFFRFVESPIEPLAIRIDGVAVVEVPIQFFDARQRNFCPLEIENITVVPNLCHSDSAGSISLEIIGGVEPYTVNWTNGNSGHFIDSLFSENYGCSIVDSIGNQLTLDSIFVASSSNPSVYIGPDTTLCGVGDYSIEVISFGNFSQLNWFYDGVSIIDFNDNILITNQAGIYSVQLTDSLGCTASDTIYLNIMDSLNLNLTTDEVIVCQGDSLQLQVENNGDLEWINGEEFILDLSFAEPVALIEEPTLFELASSNLCYSDTVELFIDVSNISTYTIENLCAIKGEHVVLEAHGGVSYIWQPSPWEYSDPNASATFVSPTESHVFFVEITDANGCQNMDSIYVAVVDDPLQFIKPINVITPNGDGVNDVLSFGDIEKYSNRKLTVFNQWGNVVFEQLGYENDWDGSHNGRPLPAANYFYVLNLNAHIIKSSLTIIRE